ncbi:hypothetical protein [Sinorhizobium meliloti]|uniref:hypothetical protein n=1 Tax=Rhizobium meliloti TaxID=382 RepID=UPI000FDAF089|nr:hypothetical protein [Sinorhizobium meliloti]RVG74053.1 hypothetical protein CN220_06950 [Sinorhizobium meliloti]RVH37933.1 hypothetical protein CN211_04750 [Sinorhizobium meliloti]
MPMKIFIDVEEAAERLEELIDLACRQDEVYVCRAGWPVAQLSSFPGGDEIAETLPDTAHRPGSKLVEDGKVSSVDAVWMLAAEGKPRREHDMTSAHDDLYDKDRLPR